MKLGIIGKPQSGKTTIFNAAAGRQEAVGDFSQAVHRAVIKVPDERVDRMAEIFQPKKITYAEIEFLDAPGFTGKGREAGAPEINPEVRLMDALMLVIDAYSSDGNPRGDIQNLIDEMFLADQILIEANIEKKERKAKLTGDKSAQRELDLLHKCLQMLEDGQPLIDADLTAEDSKLLRGYQFLTQKPLLIVFNVAEDRLGGFDAVREEYADLVAESKRDIAVLCGKVQSELAALDEEERAEFMAELGIEAPALEKVIQKSYNMLGLISFLTVGDPEVRAWTIKRGTTAVKAAGAVHSDMERGFIRAEIAGYDDYVVHKTLPALKAAGKSRLEGKEYVVADGDIILFRFAV